MKLMDVENVLEMLSYSCYFDLEGKIIEEELQQAIRNYSSSLFVLGFPVKLLFSLLK